LLAQRRPVVRTDSADFPELHALFGVPLLVGDRIVGAVLAGTRAPRSFHARDIERVVAAAGPMALALDHARQYEAEQSARTTAEQTVDRVMRLQSVTAALAGALTPSQAATVVVEQVMRAMNATAGAIRLLTADRDGLVEVASRGFSDQYREGLFWVALSASLPTGEAVRRQMPLLYSDIHELQAQFPDSVERLRKEGIQSLAIVPMAIQHQSLGELTLAFHERRQFTHDDRVFLDALAQVCSQTLERARLYGAEQAARRTADEARAQINTLFVTAPIGMALVDRAFRFVRINEYLTQFNDVPMQQQIGQRARDLFPELADIWERAWWRVIESGEPIVDMAVSVVLQGEERHLLMSYYPMRLPDGEITGVGTIVLDVSDRERVDRATALLAEASRELVGSVDYPTTLAGVARVAVPVLADFCIVTLTSERQGATVAAVVHRDSKREEMLRAVAGRLASTSDALTNPLGVALTSQHAIFIPDLEALLSGPHIEPEVLAAARAFNARSLIVVPLRIRDQTIGALSFVMTDSGRSYRQSDSTLAEELAWRCSQAI
ncbi:MAG TPA: GAF domain-containing protein, partial [Roseiflexaceae bacterium]|nr:GAF domain-containing protein [Roseiflexaceae bacterium]